MGKMVRYVKLVGFCGLVLFATIACSMFPESTPPPAPSGPMIVNNMPAPAPSNDGVSWPVVAVLGAVAAVWFFRDKLDANKRAARAERALSDQALAHAVATGTEIKINGVPYAPSALPSNLGVPMLESGKATR